MIARYASDPRVRVVTHARNRGIAAAYNSIVEHARGELIARLGHDDIALPDRLSRQVAIFDAHPDTGVVHGDAVTIDADGRVVGEWRSGELDQAALVQIARAPAQLPGRPDDDDPPARVRAGRRLRRRLPDVQRLRPVAAGGAAVPLPPLRARRR